MFAQVLRVCPAFSNRNFRLFFLGQFVSTAGTWLQIAAQLWVIYQMTSSTVASGILVFLLWGPIMVLAPFGGIFVDRYDIRKVLCFTQVAGIIQACVLGTLVVTHHASLMIIYILVFIAGVINAFDVPARHTYVALIVEKELLGSAMAMSEILMGLGLLLGSSFLGIIILKIGIGSAFFLNALSFLGMIVPLLVMRVNRPVITKESQSAMFVSGVKYIFANPTITLLIGLVCVVMMFGFSYRTLLPAVAQVMFNNDPRAFGWLYASPGLGAIVAALIISYNSRKLPAMLFIFLGMVLVGLSLCLIPIPGSLIVKTIELAISGFGLTFVTATIPTMIRSLTDREMFGRVIGVDIMMFYGGIAFGNFGIGYWAKYSGPLRPIGGSGIILLSIVTMLMVWRKIVRGKVL
jgi:MFS family permease